jgi:cell division protease FtsH
VTEPSSKVSLRDRLGVLTRRAARARKKLLLRWRRARVGKRILPRGQVLGLGITLIILFGTFAWSLSFLKPSLAGTELTYDQTVALMQDRRIDHAVFQDEDAQVVGSFLATSITGGPTVPSPRTANPANAPRGAGIFRLNYPKSDALTGQLGNDLVANGAKVEFDKQEPKATVRLVTTFLLPLVILANLFTLLFSLSRGSGSGIGEVTTFGRIGSKRQKRGKAAPITFDDVAGADEALAELREVRDYLADPERYEEVGAQPPKGVLLFGPPGCGKTLLAKAVAGEAGVPFFSVAGAEFVESLVGVGAARVRDLFRSVRAVAPAIVFIDELDAAGRKRGTGGGGGGSDEREQTLNQLLVEMDGFDVASGIVVMAATNRPDIIDPALMRPGRFDRHITVEQPDLHGREQILGLHASGKPVSADVDFSYLARRTPGFTGADLANVINEAALLTVREQKTEIETPELEEAIQRVLAGPKRRGRMLSPEERKRIAYHESGHCVVAAAAGRLDTIHRVSIVARSRSMGATSVERDESELFTVSQLTGQLVVGMAGIAAEQLVFGEGSTGSEHDLESATGIARDMIGRYGLNPRLGRARLVGHGADAFLGGDLPLGPVSGQTHQEMDLEIRRALEEAEASAAELLGKHRDVLDVLAARLEAEETLEGPELEGLLALVRPEVSLFGADLDLEEIPTARNGRRRPVKVQ